MRRLICLFLTLLLLTGLTGCTAGPASRESFVDLPIVTQGEQHSASSGAAAPSVRTTEADEPETKSAASEAELPVTQAAEETEKDSAPEIEAALSVTEDGVYDSKDEVALYLHCFGHLPSNYITKKDAERLGWSGGSLEPYAPGKCIGGSRFGNYEGLLPDAGGRSWTECDIDTLGAKSRGAKRIVFSNDGLNYYTDDHYEHFELLYGKED